MNSFLLYKHLYLKRSLLLLLILMSISSMIHAQENKISFEKITDSILVSRPHSYKEINNYLHPFRRDTSDLKKLIVKFKKNNYLVGQTFSENLLGIRYRNYSLFDQAIHTHQQALETAKQANSIEFRVFSLNMLGVDYRRMDANRTALDYNQESLALAETVEEPSLGLQRSIAVSHNSMGNIYLLLKQYDLAIDQFEKSRVIEVSIDNKLGLAINYQNVGNAKELQGKLDEALKDYQKSLALNTELNNSLGKIICNGSIATIFIKQGDYQKALRLTTYNLPLAAETGNKYYLAYEYLNLGWAQSKLNQPKKAQENLLKGIELAEKYKFISAISTGYDHLSELHEQQHNYKEALKYYKLAEEFDEKVSNERNSQYVNDLIIKYDSEKKNNEIKALAKQNEIAKLKLSRSQNIWIGIIGLLLLLGIILLILYRTQQLRSDKKILSLEQEAMRSQMNPHFIFNSLNAIKLYIINNEQKNAVYYLNKFSKLIRKILAATRDKVTTLAEEIETIKLYIDIENIRFSNEIESITNIDNRLNTNTIKMPSLILQPFIENTIWHGLSPKKGHKRIEVSYEKVENSHLKITITDNGIGRVAAAKIKSTKIHKGKSVGINLTGERLASFYKNYKNKYSLEFIDLQDDDKNPSGTKVVLKLPIK